MVVWDHTPNQSLTARNLVGSKRRLLGLGRSVAETWATDSVHDLYKSECLESECKAKCKRAQP